MVQFSNLTVETAVANSGAMEAETISKNGRSSKSHTSRGNQIKIRRVFFSLVMMGLCAVSFSQGVGTRHGKRFDKFKEDFVKNPASEIISVYDDKVFISYTFERLEQFSYNILAEDGYIRDAQLVLSERKQGKVYYSGICKTSDQRTRRCTVISDVSIEDIIDWYGNSKVPKRKEYLFKFILHSNQGEQILELNLVDTK